MVEVIARDILVMETKGWSSGVFLQECLIIYFECGRILCYFPFSFTVFLFAVLIIENAVFLLTQSRASDAVFTSDTVVEILTITAVFTVFCMENCITILTVDALVAAL